MGGKIEQFEDLECWKEARLLVKMIYQVANSGPFSKDFGLKDQIQRAAISVMANIAEGFETYSDLEFIRFLNIAVRSCAEVRSHAYVALDVGYINLNIFNELGQQTKKCSNFVKAFIKYLKNKT
ncbi:MAG: four helix bundle protein [Deltaproteobacteria bacterium]|nr:four helix bundle protein [Deltaproteobacteria bacterium]